MGKNCHNKYGMSLSSQVFLGNLAHGVMSVSWEWEAGVWNKGILRILFYVLSTSYVEIILETTITYPDVGVIFAKYILSRSQKLADAYPTGNLDSCSGTKYEHKHTHT